MSGSAVLVLGDQLSASNAALRAARDARVVMVEARDVARRAYHAHKLVLVWSAMRHHAAALRERGRDVTYLDDAASVGAGLSAWLREEGQAGRGVGEILVVEPSERESPVLASLDDLGVPLRRVPDDRWLAGVEDLGLPADPAEREPAMRRTTQERFYRRVRQRHRILLDADGGPIGGRWNLDAENRRSGRQLVGDDHDAPEIPLPEPRSAPDATTRAVIRRVVERHARGRIGDAESFAWPVTRRAALAAWRRFLDDRLAAFGPYEDAIVATQPTLFHAAVSPALNIGLLEPAELVADVEAAWRERRGTKAEVPLSSAEGFVRQVVGWREYMRAAWIGFGDGYRERNALGADRPLPEAFWTGETDLRCLSISVDRVRSTGWAHHIERLMIQGNVAALAGTRPSEIADWFRYAYVDGFDWVTHPNVIGMSQHADGGLVATKPYTSGGAYVDRMSDLCGPCRYDPRKRDGPDACPLTTLYWDHLARNRSVLGDNRRLAMPYRTLDRFTRGDRRAIARRADEVLAGDALAPMHPRWWRPEDEGLGTA